MEIFEENLELLERASKCWNSLQTFRNNRERCKRFTYGDQWQDMIDDRGLRMTEEEFIRSQGNFPLKNNLIRRLVRNVLGVFRNRYKHPHITADDLPDVGEYAYGMADTTEKRLKEINSGLEKSARINRLEELYSRTLEEFLISGMAVHKKWHGRRDGRIGFWTDNVSPARFFFDTSGRDFRGFDMHLAGEIHEMPLADVINTFARRVEDIARLAGLAGDNNRVLSDYSYKRGGLWESEAMIRIWEVWEKRRCLVLGCHDYMEGRFFTAAPEECDSLRQRYGDRLVMRLHTDEWWEYSFLTADGKVLDSGRSPYMHGSHPYVFKAYPFIDGEIHSFVADIIDQQKLTNRLISMYDWILRASAKGVLLFPEGALPDGADINDIVDEWSRFNGVIIYRPRAGVPLPQQVSSKSSDIGITELLEIQMKMMEDISGVNGALQGKLDSGTISGTLYSQQIQNSMTSLADLLGSYDDFMREATLKQIATGPLALRL